MHDRNATILSIKKLPKIVHAFICPDDNPVVLVARDGFLLHWETTEFQIWSHGKESIPL
jgi:hypothetical protein